MGVGQGHSDLCRPDRHQPCIRKLGTSDATPKIAKGRTGEMKSLPACPRHREWVDSACVWGLSFDGVCTAPSVTLVWHAPRESTPAIALQT